MWAFCVSTALYSSSDVANLYLAKGSAKSLHDMIVYQSQTIYPLWNNMVDAVRSVGSNRKWVLKGFLSLLMFDWFNETLEQKFKRTESSVGELTAAGAAGKCLQN